MRCSSSYPGVPQNFLAGGPAAAAGTAFTAAELVGEPTVTALPPPDDAFASADPQAPIVDDASELGSCPPRTGH